MIRKLRIRLAKFIMPPLKVGKPTDTVISESDLLGSYDAAVETDGPEERWQPEQKGNIVVVEPDIMRHARRNKLL